MILLAGARAVVEGFRFPRSNRCVIHRLSHIRIDPVRIRRRGCAGQYSLVDQIMAISKALDDNATLQFIYDLRVTSQVVRVDEKICGHAVDGLADTLATNYDFGA